MINVHLRDYIKARSDEPLTSENFTEVDAALLSTMCLLDTLCSIPLEGSRQSKTFEQVIDAHVRKHGIKKLGLILPLNITRTLVLASKTKRYKNLEVYNLHNHISKELNTQSTFFTIQLDDKTDIIVFGSTDDTTIGWSENIELLISDNVTCLSEAKEYLENHFYENKQYILIGHSKGGFECAYSFLKTSEMIQKNVIIAYDFDGPGLSKAFVEENQKCKYLSKLKLICPQESYIGRLFTAPTKYTIVKSTGLGLFQHNPNTWLIEDNKFKRVNSFKKSSTTKLNALVRYIEGLDKKSIKELVYSLNKIIDVENTASLTELAKQPFKILRRFKSLPKENKKMLNKVPMLIVTSKLKTKIKKTTK